MEKMKVLAVAKDMEKSNYSGKMELAVYLGEAKDFADGFVPVIKRGKNKNGEKYAVPFCSIAEDDLKGYRPAPGDLVNVSFDRYGNVVSIHKANA